MRTSVHVRRGMRISAAAAIVAAGAVQLASPAHAAPAGIERVGYTCTAQNSVINMSLQGPQQFYVTAETTLPDQVDPGDSIPATATTLTLFLPPKLVNRLTGPMEVERVKGSATSQVDLQAVASGGEVIDSMSPSVNDLVVDDWVTLTPDTEVPIVANGTVAPITVPSAPEGDGLIYVQMPASFVLHSQMDPPVIGAIAEADLNCVRDSDDAASRVIGTIPIGAGCSEADCPLPAAAGGGNGGGGNGGGPGDGSGTDPEVIDPVIPDDENDVDPYDPESAVSANDDDSELTSTTTELPATGSPFAVWLAGAFAALTAVRLALVVRARRTGV